MTWKEFAWDGFCFMAPSVWQVGKIGPRYLMLEDESGPALEIKSGRVKGRFSHKAHLRRLATLHGKKLREPLREDPIPSEWEKALDKYEAINFSWRGETIGGMGVLVYCAHCRRATLIQFYQKGRYQRKNIYRRILESFRDHRKDNQVIWSVFDIRAMLPERFKLVRHRFEAGAFELVFKTKAQKITLHRWGPASILLRDIDLIRFAQTMIPHHEGKVRYVIEAGNNAVEWGVKPSPSLWDQWWSKIKRKPAFQWYRLWHLEEKNRILGVLIQGKRAIDSRFLNLICTNYESI